MARSNNDAPRAPMIESLESRQLFATAPLPDLVPTLSFNTPTIVQAGANIAPVLTITNNGAAFGTKAGAKKIYVPIRLYVSPTPTLAAGAQPFKTIQEPLALATGKSKNVTLTSTLPAVIHSKNYYIIVKVNNAQALAESNQNNNTVVSSRLSNPIGKYAGNFSASDGHPGTLTLDLSSNPNPSSTTASVLTDLTIVSNGITIRLSAVKAKITSAGNLILNAKGSFRHPALGHTGYKIRVNATLSNNNTFTGTLKLYYQSNTTSRNATCTFTLKRA